MLGLLKGNQKDHHQKRGSPNKETRPIPFSQLVWDALGPLKVDYATSELLVLFFEFGNRESGL